MDTLKSEKRNKVNLGHGQHCCSDFAHMPSALTGAATAPTSKVARNDKGGHESFHCFIFAIGLHLRAGAKLQVDLCLDAGQYSDRRFHIFWRLLATSKERASVSNDLLSRSSTEY